MSRTFPVTTRRCFVKCIWNIFADIRLLGITMRYHSSSFNSSNLPSLHERHLKNWSNVNDSITSFFFNASVPVFSWSTWLWRCLLLIFHSITCRQLVIQTKVKILYSSNSNHLQLGPHYIQGPKILTFFLLKNYYDELMANHIVIFVYPQQITAFQFDQVPRGFGHR